MNRGDAAPVNACPRVPIDSRRQPHDDAEGKDALPPDPPAKLATDLAASAISLYFFWQHQLVIALALHFVPALIASGLVIRYAALERYRDSAFGRYLARHMTRLIEGVRLFGDIVTGGRRVVSRLAPDRGPGFRGGPRRVAQGLLPSGLGRR